MESGNKRALGALPFVISVKRFHSAFRSNSRESQRLIRSCLFSMVLVCRLSPPRTRNSIEKFTPRSTSENIDTTALQNRAKQFRAVYLVHTHARTDRSFQTMPQEVIKVIWMFIEIFSQSFWWQRTIVRRDIPTFRDADFTQSSWEVISFQIFLSICPSYAVMVKCVNIRNLVKALHVWQSIHITDRITKNYCKTWIVLSATKVEVS